MERRGAMHVQLALHPIADGEAKAHSVQVNQPSLTMNDLAFILLPIAAIGYSFLYMLFGGGLVGAVVIFFIAKAFGK